jgi:hypothetical protein
MTVLRHQAPAGAQVTARLYSGNKYAPGSAGPMLTATADAQGWVSFTLPDQVSRRAFWTLTRPGADPVVVAVPRGSGTLDSATVQLGTLDSGSDLVDTRSHPVPITQADLAAVHDTDVEREQYVPARLSDAALRAVLVPRPAGGSDAQTLVKSGSSFAWASLPFSPTQFGAAGDLIADDTTACQAAINAAQAAGGGIVALGSHRITGDLLITGANIKVRGGYLRGAGITVSPAAKADIDFEVSGLTIDAGAGTIVTGRHGITLRNCGRGLITRNTILNTDRAIYVAPVNTVQHVRRIRIVDNHIGTANYAFHALTDATLLASTDRYGTGDIHWQGNQSSSIAYTHLLATGLDGIVCKDNTMFSGAAGNPTSLRHIDFDVVNWTVIGSNNLFECGTESIRLSRFQNCNVHNNNIAWPGQRALASGILLEGGDVQITTGQFNLSSISDNTMMYPTKHGIEVADACGYMGITGNHIFGAGNATYYQGATDITSITHYGVITGAGTVFIRSGGNSAPQNTFSFGGNGLYDGNMDSSRIDASAGINLTPGAAATSFSISGGVKYVNLTGGTVRTITSITGGFNGARLVLVSFTNSVTLQNNASILLKGSVDTVIPTGATLQLFFSSGFWRELSRSF